MNEVSFRAMLIGVGVFITVATISAILIYYNVTVNESKIISQRTNIEFEYSTRINSLLDKTILTGTEVRNIIRYFYLNPMVEIYIVKINGISVVDDNTYKNVNNTWQVEGKKVISEYNMERINPSYKGKIIKNQKVGKKQIINIEFQEANSQDLWDYTYTGNVETFITTKSGWYLVELWGASGYGADPNSMTLGSRGGKGGYVSAKIKLLPGDLLNINVGGKGGQPTGGYNGGGNGGNSGGWTGGGGGGATDVKYNNIRILVAGGGGGADNIDDVAGGDNDGSAGNGGGFTGGDGFVSGNSNASDSAAGGTQTTGYSSLGHGQSAIDADKGGGGGGYYGGFASTNVNGGGGGGSGYISSTCTYVTNTTINDGYTGNGKAKITYIGS